MTEEQSQWGDDDIYLDYRVFFVVRRWPATSSVFFVP